MYRVRVFVYREGICVQGGIVYYRGPVFRANIIAVETLHRVQRANFCSRNCPNGWWKIMGVKVYLLPTRICEGMPAAKPTQLWFKTVLFSYLK